MSVLGAWVADELDSGADVTLVWPGATQSSSSADASITPAGIGKSFYPTNSHVNGYVRFPFGEQAGKTLYFQDYIYIDSDSSSGALFAFCNNFGNDQVSVRLSAANKLELYRGSTWLLTGTQVLTQGFHVIDMELLVANSGGVAKVYIDGNTVADIDFSGDTQQEASNGVYLLYLGFNIVAGAKFVRHWRPILFNIDGDKDNGRVPMVIKHGILHTIADTADIYTPSTGATIYDLVDNLMGAPNDISYGSSSTLNDRNVCELTALPADVGRVVALITNSRVGKPEAGTVGVKIGITDGVSETQSAERLLPASFTNYVDVFEYLTGTTEYDTADTLYISTEITTAG